MSAGSPVVVAVPGSKSVTHRAFLLAALSRVPCRVEAPLLGEDCRSTLAVLRSMGARFTVGEGAVDFEPIDDLHAGTACGVGPRQCAIGDDEVCGPGCLPDRALDRQLDCGNSGTTLRLMLGQAARLRGVTTLTGDASLRTRPNGPLLDTLRARGAEVSHTHGRAPIAIGGPISPGAMALPPGVSSQYASSLMLAAALLDGDSVLRLPPPVSSRPYLGVTRAVAAGFGVALHFEPQADRGLWVRIPGGQRPAAERYTVEGDWSAAAFPLVAAAVLGRPVALTGLSPHSAQGDRIVPRLVASFGPRVVWRGRTLCLEPAPLVAPADPIDLGATPDLFPPLVALAALAEGETTFVGAPSLREKECDRITAMAEGLLAVGIECRERPDGLWVRGGKPWGGAVRSHGDHRIHMAFSVLARCAHLPLTVDGRGCEAVSYPDFHRDLDRLAG